MFVGFFVFWFFLKELLFYYFVKILFILFLKFKYYYLVNLPMNYQLPYSEVFHIVSFEKVLIKVDGEEHYFFT